MGASPRGARRGLSLLPPGAVEQVEIDRARAGLELAKWLTLWPAETPIHLIHSRGFHECKLHSFDTSYKTGEMKTKIWVEFFSHASALAPQLDVGKKADVQFDHEMYECTLNLTVTKRRRKRLGDGYQYEVLLEGKM